MSQKKKLAPSEIPKPDTNPEVNPVTRPEEPAMPGEDPEIIPENAPVDPTPAEIPVPPQKNTPDKM